MGRSKTNRRSFSTKPQSPKFKPSTPKSSLPSNFPQKPKTNLSDNLKQGVATGVGFGVAQAATSSLINGMMNSETPPDNSKPPTLSNLDKCSPLVELFKECLQSNTPESCHYIEKKYLDCLTRY